MLVGKRDGFSTPKTRFVKPFLDRLGFDTTPHNPKVVGSSPASATKKVQLPFWVTELFLVIEFEFVLSVFGL